MVRVYHICLSIHLSLSSWTSSSWVASNFCLLWTQVYHKPYLKRIYKMLWKQRGAWTGRCIRVDCENEETFPIQMTEGKCLWGGAAVCAHWKQAGHGALGESTHDLSVEGVSMLGLSAGQVGGEELPTTLCVMVYSLLQDPALVPVEGPKLTVNRNITCRHGRWQDQITNHSAISQVPLPPLP